MTDEEETALLPVIVSNVKGDEDAEGTAHPHVPSAGELGTSDRGFLSVLTKTSPAFDTYISSFAGLAMGAGCVLYTSPLFDPALPKNFTYPNWVVLTTVASVSQFCFFVPNLEITYKINYPPQT